MCKKYIAMNCSVRKLRIRRSQRLDELQNESETRNFVECINCEINLHNNGKKMTQQALQCFQEQLNEIPKEAKMSESLRKDIKSCCKKLDIISEYLNCAQRCYSSELFGSSDNQSCHSFDEDFQCIRELGTPYQSTVKDFSRINPTSNISAFDKDLLTNCNFESISEAIAQIDSDPRNNISVDDLLNKFENINVNCKDEDNQKLPATEFTSTSNISKKQMNKNPSSILKCVNDKSKKMKFPSFSILKGIDNRDDGSSISKKGVSKKNKNKISQNRNKKFGSTIKKYFERKDDIITIKSKAKMSERKENALILGETRSDINNKFAQPIENGHIKKKSNTKEPFMWEKGQEEKSHFHLIAEKKNSFINKQSVDNLIKTYTLNLNKTDGIEELEDASNLEKKNTSINSEIDSTVSDNLMNNSKKELSVIEIVSHFEEINKICNLSYEENLITKNATENEPLKQKLQLSSVFTENNSCITNEKQPVKNLSDDNLSEIFSSQNPHCTNILTLIDKADTLREDFSKNSISFTNINSVQHPVEDSDAKHTNTNYTKYTEFNLDDEQSKLLFTANIEYAQSIKVPHEKDIKNCNFDSTNKSKCYSMEVVSEIQSTELKSKWEKNQLNQNEDRYWKKTGVIEILENITLPPNGDIIEEVAMSLEEDDDDDKTEIFPKSMSAESGFVASASFQNPPENEHFSGFTYEASSAEKDEIILKAERYELKQKLSQLKLLDVKSENFMQNITSTLENVISYSRAMGRVTLKKIDSLQEKSYKEKCVVQKKEKEDINAFNFDSKIDTFNDDIDDAMDDSDKEEMRQVKNKLLYIKEHCADLFMPVKTEPLDEIPDWRDHFEP